MRKLDFGFVVMICLVVIVSLLTFLSGYAKPAPKPTAVPSPLPREIRLATYPVGMSQYVIATGLAKIITENTPMTMAVKPLVGPTVYTPQLNAGEHDMVADSGASLLRAYQGIGEYKEKCLNLRVLFREHVKEVTVLAVKADSNIKKMSDLKGKRVTTDFGGNMNIVREVELALLSGGLFIKDIVPVPVASMTDAQKAFRDGRADAFFAGTPSVPGVVEINSTMPVRLLAIERPFAEVYKQYPEAVNWLPGTTDVVIKPVGVLKEEILGMTLPMWEATRADFSEEAAYLITKAIFEHAKEAQPIAAELKQFSPKIMVTVPPVPYHAGAIRLFKEKGVWTDELEKAQKALLK